MAKNIMTSEIKVNKKLSNKKLHNFLRTTPLYLVAGNAECS